MGNPASLDDVQILWRPLESDEQAKVQRRLDQSWRALVAELPNLEQRIASGEVDADSAADVVVAATIRVLNNPEGLTTFNETLDDYTHGGTFSAQAQSSDLYFTAAELRRLSPVRGAGGGAFTIMPGR